MLSPMRRARRCPVMGYLGEILAKKHHVFFSIFFATLTDKNDVIMDWQCDLGDSITACRSIERHIIALDSDPLIFNAILLPMRELQLSRTSRSIAS